MIHHITKLGLPSSGMTLFVFGDLQSGSDGFCKESWQEFKRQFKECPGEKMALGLGDYGDFLRPSLRPAVESALKKDDSARALLDSSILKYHDTIIDSMAFLDKKLVGIHEGHHTWKLASGLNLDQRLASALHAPYLGWTASTRLVFQHPARFNGTPQGFSLVYTVVSSHGNANGSKVGSAANWMEGKMVAGFVADHYIMGHGCKNANFVPQERVVIRRTGAPGVDNQIPRCLVVGGFSRGYTNGWESSYVERAGMVPQPVGWGMIRFKARACAATSASRGFTNTRSPSLDVEQVNVTPAIA